MEESRSVDQRGLNKCLFSDPCSLPRFCTYTRIVAAYSNFLGCSGGTLSSGCRRAGGEPEGANGRGRGDKENDGLGHASAHGATAAGNPPSSSREFPCPLCVKSFSQVAEIEAHVAADHAETLDVRPRKEEASCAGGGSVYQTAKRAMVPQCVFFFKSWMRAWSFFMFAILVTIFTEGLSSTFLTYYFSHWFHGSSAVGLTVQIVQWPWLDSS
jgi:hypothetical protein